MRFNLLYLDFVPRSDSFVLDAASTFLHKNSQTKFFRLRKNNLPASLLSREG